LSLALESRRDPEAGQPDLAGCRVDQHMRGFDVLVDETPPVHLANGGRQADGEPQEESELHGRSQQLIQRLTARIFEQERAPTLVWCQGERSNGPRSV
jgi:hypothetical protein